MSYRRNVGLSRRELLRLAGNGFGSLALAWMLHRDAGAEGPATINPSAPRAPHFEAKAKCVIHLFMHGGPSHLDTYDPKPLLNRLAGQPLPPSFGTFQTNRSIANNPLLPSKRTFSRHGESGIEVSDLLPGIASRVDDIAIIRSCWADSVDHPKAILQMNTGAVEAGRPSLGGWASYGLGTINQDLPSFVVLPHESDAIKGGAPAYGAGFLPAYHQGTLIHGGSVSELNLSPQNGMNTARQRRVLDLVGSLDGLSKSRAGEDPRLDAKIQSYELAYRMQAAAPEAVDLSAETQATRRLYGIDDPTTSDFGRRCLLARRLAERGVRFIQLYAGDQSGWDAHSNVESNHAAMCAKTDRPVAGLLEDLKGRGLLDSTLVIWGGEFGRTPMSENGRGRDHNPHGFTVWMAGGGIKGGIVHGATDEVGLRAEVDRAHVHDLHATVLHLLGIDHTRLTFAVNGRDERPTLLGGRVIRPLLS